MVSEKTIRYLILEEKLLQESTVFIYWAFVWR